MYNTRILLLLWVRYEDGRQSRPSRGTRELPAGVRDLQGCCARTMRGLGISRVSV